MQDAIIQFDSTQFDSTQFDSLQIAVKQKVVSQESMTIHSSDRCELTAGDASFSVCAGSRLVTTEHGGLASTLLRRVLVLGCMFFLAQSAAAQGIRLGSLNPAAVSAEVNVVKLYGAGGRGLDAFQSGFFISADGHILTVWSTVLDVDEVVVVSSDGGRFASTIVGIDPNLEIAVLKTDEAPVSYFDLKRAKEAHVGQRVMALSNLFAIAAGSEMSSVQKGVVMARTTLNARRGAFESVYQGPVLVIDAMTNNPGAAGGALTTTDGELLGMLGKELRDASANTWLNYAIPASELQDSVDRIIAGKSVNRVNSTRRLADRPVSLKELGIVLIPNILIKTPAFVDLIETGSVASRAGLQSDDLILFVNSSRVSSQGSLVAELKFIDRADELTLMVQRGKELKEITLSQ